MSTIVVAFCSTLILLLAYRFYGSYLAKYVFKLDDHRDVPAVVQEDNVDFVPTRKSIVFGHHFTSIAGTGPIVGPAIAVFWGWLPAILWVLIGGIFVGAVHDFGALVVSLRNRGETIGQTAGRLINPRARLLFLLILFFALSVVLGVFGLVIAQIFHYYPSSVLGTWISLPLAIVFGLLLRRGGVPPLLLTAVCMLIVYAAVWLGAYYCPIEVNPQQWMADIGLPGRLSWFSPVIFWTFILLFYCFAASVMPVWLLLQPRDYINSWQLILALIVLVLGVFASGLTGKADLANSTPMLNINTNELPAGTPAMFPFLFTTIACGAISGFHCLVSSGTTSKQIAKESDALTVGYGSMLLESGLAVMVILACCAGIGMGKFQRLDSIDQTGNTKIEYVAGDLSTDIPGLAPVETKQIVSPTGEFGYWKLRYDAKREWGDFSLAEKVGAFIDGGASFLTTLSIPIVFGQAILAVLVACFAATTLDSATRLQRYVIQELGTNLKIRPLTDRYVATSVAVGIAAGIALMPGSSGTPGTGGTLLWPLFGATNQLLAGLAFLVIAFYLWRRNLPIYFLVPPLFLMLLVPLWAMGIQLFSPESGFLVGKNKNFLLGGLGLVTIALQIWMIVEAAILFPKVKGHRERRRG